MNRWLFILCLFSSTLSFAQNEPLEAPYKRFPTLPPLQLLLGDSATTYTKNSLQKNKPTLVMLFSPDCSHCQQTATDLPLFTKRLKGIQIVMATVHGITPMNEFIKKYKLNEIPDLVVGKDMYFLLPPFFAVKNFPYHAFYDKKGKLISVFEGSMPLMQIVTEFKKGKAK